MVFTHLESHLVVFIPHHRDSLPHHPLFCVVACNSCRHERVEPLHVCGGPGYKPLPRNYKPSQHAVRPESLHAHHGAPPGVRP